MTLFKRSYASEGNFAGDESYEIEEDSLNSSEELFILGNSNSAAEEADVHNVIEHISEGESKEDEKHPPKKQFRKTAYNFTESKARRRQVHKQFARYLKKEANKRYGNLFVSNQAQIACEYLKNLILDKKVFATHQFDQFIILIDILRRLVQNDQTKVKVAIQKSLTLDKGQNIFHYFVACTGRGTGNAIKRAICRLREFGLDINQQDEYGQTPLQAVISKRSFYRARQLVACGADPIVGDVDGNNSMHYLIAVLKKKRASRPEFLAISELFKEIINTKRGDYSLLMPNVDDKTWFDLVGYCNFTELQNSELDEIINQKI
jgi:hypothetical protein